MKITRARKILLGDTKEHEDTTKNHEDYIKPWALNIEQVDMLNAQGSIIHDLISY